MRTARSRKAIPVYAALVYLLPDDTREDLIAHCAASGEDPADIVADAVKLHLDALAGVVDDDPRPELVS